jgi:hypothetical protein
MNVKERTNKISWDTVSQELDTRGYALVKDFLSEEECDELVGLYDGPADRFRSTINMSRYSFGSGQYKYFSYPLPRIVNDIRECMYPYLAQVANHWAAALGTETRWPDSHAEFVEQCHKAEQKRPTPLLLRYAENDYNCLHQDLYGEVYFPLQMIFMLSNSLSDFEGGELVLVENRPRMQSRATSIELNQGSAAIIPVRERPRKGARGYHKVQIRHGVSEITRGNRQTLGVIFHDAS